MEADIHAVILLLTVPVSGFLIWRFRVKPFSLRQVAERLFLALVFGFLIVVAFPNYTSGPGNQPWNQLNLLYLEGSVIWALVDKRWIRSVAALVTIVIGFGLGLHFYQLIGTWGAGCRYTGNTIIINNCKKPVVAHRLWHTWITGLYEIQIK